MANIVGAASNVTATADGVLLGIARPTDSSWMSIKINNTVVHMATSTASELHYLNLPIKSGDVISWTAALRSNDTNGHCLKIYPYLT